MNPTLPSPARRHALVRGAACTLAWAAAGLAASPAALGQAYPSKPIRLIVPYAPGGAGDVIARIVSQHLATDLKTSVVVDNKPGASGMIGAAAVASAPADGYTILLGNTTEWWWHLRWSSRPATRHNATSAPWHWPACCRSCW